MVMTQERRPKKARDDSISHPNKVQIDYDKERRGNAKLIILQLIA